MSEKIVIPAGTSLSDAQAQIWAMDMPVEAKERAEGALHAAWVDDGSERRDINIALSTEDGQ